MCALCAVDLQTRNSTEHFVSPFISNIKFVSVRKWPASICEIEILPSNVQHALVGNADVIQAVALKIIKYRHDCCGGH